MQIRRALRHPSGIASAVIGMETSPLATLQNSRDKDVPDDDDNDENRLCPKKRELA